MTPRRVPGPANRLVAVLICDGLALFEFGIVAEVFGLRRPELGVPWYDMVTVSFDQPPLEATGGVRILPTHSVRMLAKAGTIVIPNWPRLDETPPAAMLDAVRAAHKRGARLLSICSGAFVLAAAGLLDGRRATTHWMHADRLARRYPAVQVEPSVLYIESGRVFTSAGSAAGIDLGLHIVRQDYGFDIANKVARRMVVAPHREGGQSQFVATAMAPVEGSLAPLMEWASARLDEPLTVEALACKGRMSLRTLARRFEAQAGTTPHQWLTHQRVLAAQRLLETSGVSIDRVAELSGFVTAETLRHHFRQRVGTSPMAYRRRFAQSA
ncbi:MAG: transcriptional regulator FtrA [Acidobacteria bacterium]|nr:transcriptional regulator FtrA [Acidobacteriota bacterium]